MSNQVEYGIRINVSGNRPAVTAIDEVSAAHDRLGASAVRVGGALQDVQVHQGATTTALTGTANASRTTADALDQVGAANDRLGASADRVGGALQAVQVHQGASTAAMTAATTASHSAAEAIDRVAQADTSLSTAAQHVTQVQSSQATSASTLQNAQQNLGSTLASQTTHMNNVVGGHQAVQQAARNTTNVTQQLGVSQAQLNNAMRQVPAQFTDIVTSLQGGQAPLTVLLQQGGQLRDSFGSAGAAARGLASYTLGLIGPWTIAAAVAGALAIAYNAGANEAEEFAKALALSGNAAGATVGQLQDVSRQIGEVTGSQHEAAAAVAVLASTGQVAMGNMREFGTVAVEAQRVLGRSVADTAEEFAALGKAPLSALEKINDKYHFITAATFDQVKALLDVGRAAEAADVAQRAYADGVDKQKQKVLDSLTDWERGWLRIKKAASGATDAVIDFAMGRGQTASQKIDSLVEQRGEIEENQRRARERGFTRDVAIYQAELDNNQRQINAIRARTDAEKGAAKAQEQAAQKATARKQWNDDSDKYLTRTQQRDRDLDKAQNAGVAAGATQKEIDDRKAAIRKSYADLNNVALAAIEGQRNLEKEQTANSLADLESRHKRQLVSDVEYINQKRALDVQDVQRDIEAAKKRANLASSVGEIAERNKYLAQVQALEEKRRGIINGADGALAESSFAATKAISSQVQAWGNATASERAALADETELFGKSAEARKIAAEQMKVDAELRQFVANWQKQGHVFTVQETADLEASAAARKEDIGAIMGQRQALAGAEQLRQQNARFAAESIVDDKARALALLEIDAEVWRERIQLAGDGTDAQKKLQAQYDTWYANRLKAAMSSVDVTKAKEMLDIMSALDESAKSAADGMAASFGKVGSAIGGLTTTLSGYGRAQAAIAAQLAAATKDAGGNQAKIQKANATAAAASAQAQIKSYGDMASAAKGFFKENSAGYRAMEGVEKTFRAFEMAMAAENMLRKTGLLTAYTTAYVASKQTETAATEASVAPDVAASMAKGQAAAVAGVANQAAGDPYSAWVRMAAMAAVMVGLGFAVSGGGSGPSLSEQRQQAQGAGSVLGDSSAKSESIKNAIELSASNSSTQINYLSGMLTALRNIENNIGSFASQLIRTTDVTNPSVPLNNNNGLGKTIASWAAGGVVVGSLLAKIPVLGNIFGKVGTSIFGGKQSVEDSGITMSPTALAAVLSAGANVSQYTAVKTSGGWFGSDKHSTVSTALGADANGQITNLIKSLADSVQAAGGLLGMSGDEFTAKLNAFVVDIGNVSLKDLKGDDLQKALESVFSKLGDNMAQFAVGGLQQFQKVGEGYLETLVRVGADYAKLDASLTSIGKTFGATGLQSVAARESLVDLMGGIDELQSTASSYAENFLTQAQRLAPVQKYVTDELARLNLGWVDTREKFAQVVTGLDLTTEAGQSMYATLMGLSEAFAATHEAIKDTTKSAQDIADERRDLQDQLDELTMTSVQLREKERAAIDASNKALYDQVQAIQAAKEAAATLLGNADAAYSVLEKVVNREKTAVQKNIDAHTEAVNRLQGLSQALHSAVDSLTSPAQQMADRARAQAEIQADLAITKAGGTLSDNQVESLKKALSAATQDASGQFATYQDYLHDLYQTRDGIEQLGDLTDDSLSIEKDALETAQAQLQSLDAILSHAQEEIDILKGIDTNGLSLVQAMDGLGTAIAAAHANPIAGATSSISQAYQSALGRAPDANGLEFWQNQAAAGSSISAITDAIGNSAEAQIKKLYKELLGRSVDAGGLDFWMHSGASIDEISEGIKGSSEYKTKVPGFASGGDFAGGWRIVGENGPELEATGPARIFSARQTQSIFNGSAGQQVDITELVEQMKLFYEEAKLLREANSQENYFIAKYCQQIADHMDGAVNGDVPFAVKAIPA
jgi:phage-related minor tail protein